MYVYGRLFKVLVAACFKPRLDALAEIRTPMRIWPNDLDFNLHVNNGRYLTLFDLGRMDLTFRTGLWRLMLKRRWLPVLSTAAIRFRRSVGAFTKVVVSTRVIYWDEKWLYIEHRLERPPATKDSPRGELLARALVKGVFRGPEGTIPMPRLLEALQEAVGQSTATLPLSPSIETWRAFEKELV